jgi:branched-chain amino acid aminotransferase
MSSGPRSLASLDGDIMLASEAMIPATDEGLIRGDGAFEVVRIYDGMAFAMDEHLARMQRSGDNLRLQVDLEAIRADAYRLLARASVDADATDHQLLRMIVTRGGRRLLLTEPLKESTERIRLLSTTYEPTRILDGVKSLSYAANMLATRLAQESGFDDAVLVTPDRCVLEAPTRSIFWVMNGVLCTTPLDAHILASITRALIMEATDVSERAITLDELYTADEVFVASTTREVHPVCAVDDHEYPGPDPVTERTAALVADRVAAKLSA